MGVKQHFIFHYSTMDSKINRKKRIITDLQRLREPPEPHLPKYDIRQEKANDLNVIYTEIRGPEGSNYEGGYFVLRFEFTSDYPVSSPSVAFATKIWHPNVDHNSGSVCLNSLNQNWQPTVSVRHILDTHMPWLLLNGNPDDPLNADAGTQMKAKDPKYQSMVKQWVKKFAARSQLNSCGTLWYKDQPKKKKKKKKFNIKEILQHKTTKKKIVKTQRKSSKSVGHIDDDIDFQDWWTQSKLLPNTPSTKPQIPRSHSFCNRKQNNMKLISLQQFDDDDIEMNFIRNDQQRKRKKHKKNIKEILDDDKESDLSSMDDDPIYDLQRYQSLTSQNIQSLASSQSQTPSFHSISTQTLSTNTNYTNYTRINSDIYSKSDGFIPQINHSFICPEFSPLSPAKYNNNNHTKNNHNPSNERILHFAPINDEEDDDLECSNTAKSIKSKLEKLKQHKLVDIDIDMKDNKNILKMSLD